MNEVSKIYYDKDAVQGRGYATGLIIQLTDGSLLAHQSTDPVMPFEPFQPKAATPTRQHATKCTALYGAGCVCDGYHTFDELYDHRITLYLTLCRRQSKAEPSGWWSQVWRSKLHSDGKGMHGWFVLGIGKAHGTQITYHVPLARWDDTDFAETLEVAPEWDGHTSDDVLDRLREI
jgi:hypothetical protein